MYPSVSNAFLERRELLSSRSTVSLDGATLISIILEGIFYGFSTLMFIISIWSLTYNRTRNEVSKPMFVVACTLLAFSTAHLVIDIYRTYTGFITSPLDPISFFSSVAEPTWIAKSALYVFMTLVGDAVVIFRCYKVWGQFRAIILPAVGFCAISASGTGALVTSSKMQSGVFDSSPPGRFATAFYTSTLFTNTTSTLLLAYRIWSVDREVSHARGFGSARLQSVFSIVIDAGVLYSATLITALVLLVVKSENSYIVLDLIVPIISITFYMVIIRVGLDNKRQHDSRPDGMGVLNADEEAGLNRQIELQLQEPEKGHEHKWGPLLRPLS